MDKVIAVVVTYNRQRLLQQCINALRNQTQKLDKILVINNGSTDSTEAWLANETDIDYITQSNTGSAGGFATGIKAAYDLEYSWIWLMDDDGYPKADALEKILEDDNEQLCLRNCAVVNINDKKSFVWKTKNFKTVDEVKDKVIKNVAHPFNGTMLHRKIVERVGLPMLPLFIFGDETEYYFRIIKKNKIPFCTISESIHYHPATSLSYRNDWNYHTTWKMYYYLRNRLRIMQSQFNGRANIALMMYLGFLIAFAGSVIVFQKTNKLKKVGFIVWPATDALLNNFSVTPSLIMERLKKKPSHTFDFIPNYLKYIKNIFTGNITPSSVPD
jgi:GT2 family glycosyltransferase